MTRCNVSEEDRETDCDPKNMLVDQLQDELRHIPETLKYQLITLLGEYNHVFSLIGNNAHRHRGCHIPRKQPVRRVPFAVHQEVARQLMQTQDQGLIQPSSSSWASPIVLARKKGTSFMLPVMAKCKETLRICV